MSPPLLKLEDISKTSNNFALNDVTLDLDSGEVHVLMGENGSGKSLLMQIASGAVEVDYGKICYKGEYITDKSQLAQLSASTLYLKQDSGILEMLSIPENLFFEKLPYKCRFLHSIDFEKLNSMCIKLINEFNLPFTIYDDIRDLGFAQQQIIKICRAYLSNADIIIFDDLFSGLLDLEKNILYVILDRLKERGVGVFYITHNLNEVMQIGDRVTIIKNGRLQGTLCINESSEQDIINLLSAKHRINSFPKLNVPIGKPLLSVKNLNSIGVLKNIDLELKKGEILGVTGLAGSGRTLLANCLFGFAPYTVSSFEINGNPVSISTPYDAIKNGIALVPEDRVGLSMFRYLDIFENVAFSSMKRFTNFFSINSMLLRQSVNDYIATFNIQYMSPDVSIYDYSSGNQQKAIIAKWIMSREKIFIFDEPTKNIDIASKIDIYNSICNLVQKGVSVIIMSSDIDEIMGVCDRVAVLANNSLVCNEKVSDITKTDIIRLSINSSC